MTPEQLTVLSWRFDDEAFNKGNLDIVEELIHPNFVNHDPLPGQSHDKAGVAPAVVTLRQGFPDLQFVNDEIIAQNDIVAHRATITGTHQGEYLGVAATGQQIVIRLSDFQRWQDGKMIERWSIADTTDLVAKLGLS
jgi:steroid delta-isomerase-like uncharacterized protein